ncbi:MAG: hypothetical protein KJ563_08140 [Candidatus Thermoplasmatota archaeon]|nr:hypothetical protein [Candidatus Thermoplasmatota archaeon]
MARMRVQFKGGESITIQLRPEPTPTIEALLTAVPFSSNASTWGDEVYFSAPFHAELETDARVEMEIGDVAFWPDGDAIAVFFGRTPASVDDKPRAYSLCNLIGTLEGDISALKRVKPGSSLEVAHAR